MSHSKPDESNDAEWKYSPVDGRSDLNDADALASAENGLSGSDEALKKKEKQKAVYKWSALNAAHQPKSFYWYSALIALTLIFGAVIYLLTKDKITTAVILVSGLLIGVYASKKPRMVEYKIDGGSFKVGSREYNFSSFRSFMIARDGDHISAMLVPLKRFMPYMYINFTADMESKVTGMLSNLLPFQTLQQDFIDRVLRHVGY